MTEERDESFDTIDAYLAKPIIVCFGDDDELMEALAGVVCVGVS